MPQWKAPLFGSWLVTDRNKPVDCLRGWRNVTNLWKNPIVLFVNAAKCIPRCWPIQVIRDKFIRLIKRGISGRSLVHMWSIQRASARLTWSQPADWTARPLSEQQWRLSIRHGVTLYKLIIRSRRSRVFAVRFCWCKCNNWSVFVCWPAHSAARATNWSAFRVFISRRHQTTNRDFLISHLMRGTHYFGNLEDTKSYLK